MIDDILYFDNLSIGYKNGSDTILLYGGLKASLSKGSLTCVLGKNGSGKSTLLRTLSGLLPMLSGDVCLSGKKIDGYDNSELSRLVSLVLTDSVKSVDMTVREVVSLGRSPYTGFWGTLSADDEKIVDEALEMVDMNGFCDRRMSFLSDGERQKVMIAKAVAQQTPLILLDEPSAFLDYQSKVRLLILLRDLTRKLGKTILLSTHDIEHALQLSDNTWIMDRKLGFVQGRTDILCKDGTISRYFDGEGISFDPTSRRFIIQL